MTGAASSRVSGSSGSDKCLAGLEGGWNNSCLKLVEGGWKDSGLKLVEGGWKDSGLKLVEGGWKEPVEGCCQWGDVNVVVGG